MVWPVTIARIFIQRLLILDTLEPLSVTPVPFLRVVERQALELFIEDL